MTRRREPRHLVNIIGRRYLAGLIIALIIGAVVTYLGWVKT